MRVLGFDPGTIRMGYGVVDLAPHPEADDYGVIVLPKNMPLEHSLYQMYTHVMNMISVFQPDAIAVEEPFVGKGDRRFAGAALAVGQALALVLFGAAGSAIPLFRYTPAKIKSSVADYGAATKEQMQQSVTVTLSLEEPPEPDAADALSAVSYTHLTLPTSDLV